jgi:hypothetical protein
LLLLCSSRTFLLLAAGAEVAKELPGRHDIFRDRGREIERLTLDELDSNLLEDRETDFSSQSS